MLALKKFLIRFIKARPAILAMALVLKKYFTGLCWAITLVGSTIRGRCLYAFTVIVILMPFAAFRHQDYKLGPPRRTIPDFHYTLS